MERKGNAKKYQRGGRRRYKKNWFQFVAVRVVPGSGGRQTGLVPL